LCYIEGRFVRKSGFWICVSLFAAMMASEARAQFVFPQISVQQELSEGQKRKIVVPLIRSLTYCIIDYIASDDEAVVAYKEQRFSSYVQSLPKKCSSQFDALGQRYEQTYGEGSAYAFLTGPYATDLPRAVLARIKSKMDARLADYDQAQKALRAENVRQEELSRQRAEEQRAATVRAEADRNAAEAKAAVEKREQVDVAKRAMSVLRDKFYDCADKQLVGLVKSGEGADVLASAAMTVCGQSLSDLQDSAIEVAAIQNDRKPEGVSEEALRLQVKSLVKERVVADAVQAKAGVGVFAR
jgi:hypothetical protein